jgi:hypothetical protein
MKKILSVFLTAAIISFICSPAAVKAETSEDYREYALCLDALGCIDYSEEADMEKIVSREEFCEMAVRFMGISETDGGDNERTPFIDVPTEKDTYSAIRTMYNLGYISGDGARHFYPEDSITVAGAATIAVGMLGYSYTATVLGGYPSGYMSKAYEEKILTEKFESYNAPMKLGSVYRMFYNMLEVPIMEVKLQGSDMAYTSENKKTILSTALKAEKREGLVTANRYTGLASASDYNGETSVTIDGEVYSTVKNFDDMLGMNVIYYVSYKNDASGEIVYMKSEKNTVTSINSDDIEEITASRFIYTTDGGRTKNVNLASGIDVIYNGKAYTGYGALSSLELKNGSVMLIDNNRDGKADVMDITEYQNYYIDGINKSDRIIYDYERGRQLEIKPSAGKNVEIFNADGSAARFSDLKKGVLISAAQSMDEENKLIRVYRCSDTVEGRLETASEDEYSIGGNVYKAAPDAPRVFSVQDEGVFFLDINGKIADFKKNGGDDYKYAVVYNCWYDENAEATGIKLFTKEEEFKEYILPGKININGKSVKTSTKEAGGNLINMLKKGIVVRYRLIEDGSGISHIQVPLAMTEDKNGNKYPADSENFRTLFEGSSFKYRNGMFDGKVIATDETVIFSIPKSESWSDKNLFGTLKTSSFSGGTSYSKNFKAYVTGENPVNRAEVMTVEDMVRGSIGNGTNLVLVYKIVIGVDDEGDVCHVIKGVSGTNAAEYYCDEEIINSNGVQAGDVIRIGVNSAGRVNKIQKIYNADGSNLNGALLVPSEGTSENTASFDSEFRVAIGTVQDIDSGYMKFSMTKKSGEELYEESSICRTEGASVVIYDSEDKRGNVPLSCSVNDILRGDTVILRMNLAAAKEIIILR